MISMAGLVLIAFSAMGDTAGNASGPAQPSGQTSATTTQQGTLTHCPFPSELIRKNMWWRAPNNWRSYTRSFVTEIASFIGAQWVGVNVGAIICIYQGKNATDFPVTIQQNAVIVPMPTGGKWQDPDQSGRVNCYSNNVADCPFTLPKKTTITIEQAYEALQSFKSSNQNNSQESQ